MSKLNFKFEILDLEAKLNQIETEYQRTQNFNRVLGAKFHTQYDNLNKYYPKFRDSYDGRLLWKRYLKILDKYFF